MQERSGEHFHGSDNRGLEDTIGADELNKVHSRSGQREAFHKTFRLSELRLKLYRFHR